MDDSKLILRKDQLLLSKIILLNFLLLLFFIPINAQNPKSAQWAYAGGEMILSGNHSFTTTWSSHAYSRQDGNKYWQGGFWGKREPQIPFDDTVKNSVSPKVAEITIMGPGNIGLFQRTKGARIHMNDSKTKASFIPWTNSIDWNNGGTVKDFYINGEQIAAGTEITLDIAAVMSMFNNQGGTGEISFIAPQEIEYEIWFFPREGGKVISSLTSINSTTNPQISHGNTGNIVYGNAGTVRSGTIFNETKRKWLKPGDRVSFDDMLRTNKDKDASIILDIQQTRILVKKNSAIKILKKLPVSKRSGISLIAGRIWNLFSGKKNKNGYAVETFNSVAGVEGTEFEVAYDPASGTTSLSVKEGVVNFSCKTGIEPPIKVRAGMSASIDNACNITSQNSVNNTITSANGMKIYPIADSHVYAYSYSGWSKANWGKYNILGAGWHPTGGEKRTYLKFDVSRIDKATFKKATLKLYHYHTAESNSAELGVYTVRNPWNEGNGNYKPANVAAPGEVCWINQPQSDQYPVVYFNPGTQTNDFVEVDITTLVKAWLEGMPNHGLAIKAGESYLNGPTSVYGFYSREHEDIDKRPSLIINGATNGTTNTTSEGKLELPNVAGEWELTCIGDIIFKFNVKLVQSGNRFYGDMVQTNGYSQPTKIEGEILSGDRIKFTRSVGNWKQYFTGEINQKSGSQATSFEGIFGFKDQLNYEWYAKYKTK